VGKVAFKSKYVIESKIEGTILGVRQVQDKGRIQIPKTVRDKLNLRDGDSVYWVEGEGIIYIIKALKIE